MGQNDSVGSRPAGATASVTDRDYHFSLADGEKMTGTPIKKDTDKNALIEIIPRTSNTGFRVGRECRVLSSNVTRSLNGDENPLRRKRTPSLPLFSISSLRDVTVIQFRGNSADSHRRYPNTVGYLSGRGSASTLNEFAERQFLVCWIVIVST
jgi:hypothetical protein